jgi:hypothetical protein
MGYMGDELYSTEVASPVLSGASTLVVDGWKRAVCYAIEIASPVGAATLVVDKLAEGLIYATEVASPTSRKVYDGTTY